MGQVIHGVDGNCTELLLARNQGATVKKRLVIDRIEENSAVCETDDLVMTEIPLAELPGEATEGAALVFDGQSYQVDVKTQKKRRRRIKKKIDELFVD